MEEVIVPCDSLPFRLVVMNALQVEGSDVDEHDGAACGVAHEQGELEMDPAVLIFADIPNSRYYLSYSMRLFLAVSCLSISRIVVHTLVLAFEVCVYVSSTHHTRSPSGSRLLRSRAEVAPDSRELWF